MTLAPSKTLAKERDAATAAKLAEIKSKMTPEEIQKVIDTAKNLKIRQQTPDSAEALQTIPLIQISDIKKEPENLPLMYRDIDGTRILFSNLDTHGIIYLTVYFDALKVPQNKVFYAFLLNELIGRVDTRQHSYEELANLVNLNIGGFGTTINADSKKNEPNSFMPRLKAYAKCLASKVENMTAILSEIFTESIFTNKKRLREIIEEEQIGIELNLQGSANAIISARIASY